MKPSITISIIIPIYKVEQLLPRCLDALVGQSKPPFEVLLVNDGTPDNAGAIAQDYASKYPFFKYLEQENQGVSVARNSGLRQATGEYIAFCDADDYFEPFFLEQIEEVIAHNPADLYHFNYREIGNEEMMTTKEQEESGTLTRYSIKKILEQGIDLGGMMVWRYIYKRSIIEEHHVSFPAKIVVAEDDIFNFRYYKHAKDLLHIERNYYVYDRRNESATAVAFASFSPRSVNSFYQNALTLANEWGSEMPLAIQSCVEGYIFSYCRSYVNLDNPTKKHRVELKTGLGELLTSVDRIGIELKQRWRYNLILLCYLFYRWVMRTKQYLKRES